MPLIRDVMSHAPTRSLFTQHVLSSFFFLSDGISRRRETATRKIAPQEQELSGKRAAVASGEAGGWKRKAGVLFIRTHGRLESKTACAKYVAWICLPVIR